MIGDGDGVEDGAEGLVFLDRLLAQQRIMTAQQEATPDSLRHPKRRDIVAVDLRAGVGRITKLIILKRYDEI